MVLADARGTSAVEYVIGVVLVALLALGAWEALGGAVEEKVACAAGVIGQTGGPCVMAAGDGSPAIEGSTAAGVRSSLTAGARNGGRDWAGSIPTATQIALTGGDASSSTTPIALHDDARRDGRAGDPLDPSDRDPGADPSSGTGVLGSAPDGAGDSGTATTGLPGGEPPAPPPEKCAWYDVVCKGRQAGQRIAHVAQRVGDVVQSAVQSVEDTVDRAVERMPDGIEVPLRLQGSIMKGILEGAYDVTAGAVKYTIAAAENYGQLGWSIVDPNNGLSLSERLRNGVRFAVATAALTQGPTGIVMAMMIVNTPPMEHGTDNPLLGVGFGLLDVLVSPITAGIGVVRGVGQDIAFAANPYNGATLEERARALTRGTLTTGLVVAGRFGQPKGYLPYTNTAVLGQSDP